MISAKKGFNLEIDSILKMIDDIDDLFQLIDIDKDNQF